MKKCLLLIVFSPIIYLHAQTPVKKVLMEEFTTVLCGVCPPVTYDINQFHENTPNTILMTHHEGFGRDSMSNPATLTVFNTFMPSWGSFAPAIMINRTVYPTIDSLIPYLSTFTSGYDTLVGNSLLEPPIVDIQISSQYNQAANSFIATVTSTFVDPLPAASYRVNLFLVEDSVSGVGYPGYAQKCYDANFVAQHYAGYPYANDTISGYPHRYVVRNTLSGNAMGTSQTVPVMATNQSPILNSPYVFTMGAPFVIPSNYNFNRLYLVASVNRYELGSKSGNFVINAERVKLSVNSSTGINEINNKLKLVAFPNPAGNEMNISFSLADAVAPSVFVTDISGRVVYRFPESKLAAGPHTLLLRTANLDAGLYQVHLKTPYSYTVEQIVIGK